MRIGPRIRKKGLGMKDNKGFSLIEVIIVIIITVILTTGAVYSLSLIKLADVHQCANTIDDALSKLKLDTMSKADRYHYLVLEWNGAKDGFYLHGISSDVPLDDTNWSTATSILTYKKIAGSDITIAYTDCSDGTNLRQLDDDNPCILIRVAPGSGAYQSPWKQIVITGESEELAIHMITKTGKHFIK